MKLSSKKGELSDMIIFIVTIFILAVGLFILMFITPQIFGGLKTAGLNNSIEGSAAIDRLDLSFTHLINNGFMLLFVGLIISTMITSFLVRTHPIFLFLYIFFLAITILLGFYLGNAYEQLATNPVFSSMVNDASFINVVMYHIAEISLAVGALSMIIVFAKFSTFGGTQQY